MPELEQREAVRAFLLTPAHELLLSLIQPPADGERFWCTPGGGRRPGESSVACLHRELHEELGLAQPSIGPVIWRREQTFNWGPRRICQREIYHVVHVDHFPPRLLDEVEAEMVVELRWWPAAELASIPEIVAPRALARIVADYLRDGPPRRELEWVVDR